MNLGFKLRYDQMRDNDPTPSDANTPSTQSGIHDFYATPGNTRNVCLVWPDGRRLFLNYAYLITGEFIADSDKNVIKLNFSSHTISLEGYGLDRLFMALLDQLPRFITTIDQRYSSLEVQEGIIDIAVENKDS